MGILPRPVRRLAAAAATAAAVLLMLSVPASPAHASTTFVVLQMNLCNSGMAVHSCYSGGRAVDEAVERIDRYPPELVTLQEICRDDLYGPAGWGKLAGATAGRYGSGRIAVDFVPARNRYTGDWYRCVNGQPYGIALIHHYNGRDSHHGWYTAQDGSDEIRAWTCATVIRRRLTACTTHLSVDPAVALRQCRELMSILTAPWVLPEVVVAGDLNLRTRDATACTPARYDRRGDGQVQHVLFTRNLQWIRGVVEGMRWTDHPLLYQRFRV